MNSDQSIEIQLARGNDPTLPLGDIVVEIHFLTKGNFRYGFKVGRTNGAGHLRVTYSDVEAIRRQNAEASLMDYNTRLEDCDSQVRIVIPSQQQLREQADNAIRFYGSPPLWAKSWPSNARLRRQEKSIILEDTITHVDIPAEQPE